MSNTGKRALVLLIHPEPKSFNAHLASSCATELERQGYSVVLEDLYASGFDPIERRDQYHFLDAGTPFQPQHHQSEAWKLGQTPPEVKRYIELLQWADFLFLQYPIWWFGGPAMLKGWFDRVLIHGAMYRSKQRYGTGPMRGKRAMLSATVGAPKATYEHDGRNGDIDLHLWHPTFTLHYVGYTVLPSAVAYQIEGGLSYGSGDESLRYRSEATDNLIKRLQHLDDTTPISFNDWEDWDESGRLKPAATAHSAFMRKRRILDIS